MVQVLGFLERPDCTHLTASLGDRHFHSDTFPQVSLGIVTQVGPPLDYGTPKWAQFLWALQPHICPLMGMVNTCFYSRGCGSDSAGLRGGESRQGASCFPRGCLVTPSICMSLGTPSCWMAAYPRLPPWPFCLPLVPIPPSSSPGSFFCSVLLVHRVWRQGCLCATWVPCGCHSGLMWPETHRAWGREMDTGSL